MSSDYDPSVYPPVALTADLVVITLRDGAAQLLLTRRTSAPFAGCLALPGGFVRPDESAVDAASAVLSRKCGVSLGTAHLEQLGTYTDPDRDPRMRVVSVAYLCFVPDVPVGTPGVGTSELCWVDLDAVDDAGLAFDHGVIAADGIARARAKLSYTTLATSFLPQEFTLPQLRAIYEAVWSVSLHPSNFSRKVLAAPGFVVDTGDTVRTGARPARVYCAGAASELHPPIACPVHH